MRTANQTSQPLRVVALLSLATLASAGVIATVSSVPAGFDWGEGCKGVGTFSQDIEAWGGDAERAVTVGEIPAGIKDVFISLANNTDVDIRLYDVDGTRIVHWPHGILSGPSSQTTTYKGVMIAYSGFNGDGTGLGNEYIKISGITPTGFTLKAFGYQPGFATVQYSCTGTFSQDIIDWNGDYERVVTVGEIPADKKDIFIRLSNSTDVDIRLYDSDGTRIIHWPNGILNGCCFQTTQYKGVTIEYSGYNGDGRHFGNEYIKIKGTTSTRFTMKAFGYQAGFATVDYSWGRFTMFAAIHGAAPVSGANVLSMLSNIYDNNVVTDYIEAEICPSHPCGYTPDSMTALREIANSNAASSGLVAMAFHVHGTGVSRVSINDPNAPRSNVLADIEAATKGRAHAKVFLSGFSAGGGVLQNLLWDLKTLGIDVVLSGHIDSIDFIGFDERIPSNTRRAMNFYQRDSGFSLQGEDNLKAEDPQKTAVTNYPPVSYPDGPALPNDWTAYHRNMDNDERVWGPLLDYLQIHR